MLLLNPGPVSLSERVRQSLLQPDLCHREPEYFDLQDQAREGLLGVYGIDPDAWQAVLLTGSGTAALESMVSTLVPADGRLLVIANGVYGERVGQIAACYGIDHVRLDFDWLAAPEMETIVSRLDAAAREGRPFSHLAIIHHETTSGRLNALETLSRRCAERGVAILLDGVSSFGAESIDFSSPALVAVAATANKCLHGVPGIAFVVARHEALAAAAPRSFYLDLSRLAKLQAQRNTPFTPAVHVLYALVEALHELADAGGRSARHQHYRTLAERVRLGLEGLSIMPVLPPQESSVVLRAYRLPAGVDYETLHARLKAHGFIIYAGQGGLSRELFRISTMGALSLADIDRLLEAFAGLTG